LLRIRTLGRRAPQLLLDREPRPGAVGTKIVFLDPRSTFRVLMELCEKE